MYNWISKLKWAKAEWLLQQMSSRVETMVDGRQICYKIHKATKDIDSGIVCCYS